jgi:epsilon-lactone hydrolase
MATTYHNQHPLDREAVAAMRREIATHPPLAFTPSMRPVFDALMRRTPPAADVRYEPDRVGEVPGWWCRPTDAIGCAAFLYLHGGAYVMGSAFGFCHFIGQLASRAKVATFAPDYRLAPEHKFPAALDDARAALHGLVAEGATRIATRWHKALTPRSSPPRTATSRFSSTKLACRSDAAISTEMSGYFARIVRRAGTT